MKKNIFILVLTLGVPLICGALSSYDTNDDGIADKWIDGETGRAQIIKVDSDFDGRIDRTISFDNKGKTNYEEYDFDFDGQIDTYYYYGEEGLERQEVDSNSDGKVDIWVHIAQGQYMKSYERDTDYDGTVDHTKEY